MINQTIIIIGANSEIAKAIAIEVISNTEKDNNTQLIVISRDVKFYQQGQFEFSNTSRITINLINVESYLETDVQQAVETINLIKRFNVSRIFVCHGILHNEQVQPEKRLEDFLPDTFTQVLTANTITPMLWLKHLTPSIAGNEQCKIVIFTARVGSITDNKLGGWYSYRASKAAMNMLLTCASVELNRRAKNIKLISFHPGTTDSPLSKPFQKNVPEGKLFTSEFVAKQLLNIVEETEIDGKVSYLDWQGKEIPW